MNRNTENHFAELPQVEIERSIFDRSFSHKTSFNSGRLIPFFIDEVLPGDTFNVTTSCVVRLQTPLTPIMDNIYMDTYYFFVPMRILWDHAKEFFGENSQSAWIPRTEYHIPQVTFPEGGFQIGTIADYLGVPTGVYPTSGDAPLSALPFRAVAMIADQWFRDQNVMDPVNIPTGDAVTQGSNGDNYITDLAAGGMPFRVSKYHDYFTSALPGPLKHDPIEVAFTNIDDNYPVHTSVNTIGNDYGSAPMRMRPSNGAAAGSNDHYMYYESSNSRYRAESAVDSPHLTTLDERPMNLWASINYSSSVTVNELRLAFQLQKFYEKNARAGTRYREVLREHFGVTSPDARMMIPEYLGGHRFPLSIHQVTNQAQGEADFLGDLGAMSNTSDIHEDFVKSFTEHGYVIGVTCIRYDHSYPQGLNKLWTRYSKLDFYWPVFANIGEQPIKARELYFSGDPNELNDRTFGYQEAWAEYRYMPNRVSGEMRPSAPHSLASWHLADDYSEQPHLSAEWMQEDPTNIDRVLAVTSSQANQAFADFYVKNIVTRCMPMYSIPGLIDHH